MAAFSNKHTHTHLSKPHEIGTLKNHIHVSWHVCAAYDSVRLMLEKELGEGFGFLIFLTIFCCLFFSNSRIPTATRFPCPPPPKKKKNSTFKIPKTSQQKKNGGFWNLYSNISPPASRTAGDAELNNDLDLFSAIRFFAWWRNREWKSVNAQTHRGVKCPLFCIG